ncbi:hypothetical protein LX87_05184 [Larkinella arboricola]|uniref:Phage portal protein n=1 Tax=Larkinella arboricola TaxID=643671 RepID=A0A327WPG6_LARAB|nr:hypothetical protein [Larkinella arboricola]RAJ92216.1 hypothetical protein LX87_05184 [Larkinella arboricola]
MSTFRKLGAGVYALSFGSKKEAALVTFGEADVSAHVAGAGYKSRSEYVPWGAKDDQLVKMHKLASDSPNKWRLIKTRRDFTVGLGVYTHAGKEIKGQPTRYEPVIFPEFQAWKDLVNWDLEFVSMALQYGFSANAFVVLTLDTSKKLADVEVLDAFKCRVRKLKAGELKKSAFLVNPNFGTKAYKASDTKVYPAFDPKDPTKYPVSILQLMDLMPGQDYYSFPEWWSTEAWAKVANKIPKFHDSGLDNGYNLKYHISVPDDYFDKEGLTQDEKDKLMEETLQKMGESLEGTDNAEKTLFTFHQRGLSGQPVGGVIITPLKNPMSDDAYVGLFNTANVAQASGHGVLPALAGIDTGGKLGGSGKELEAAANYQQGFLTYVDRLILLQVLRIAKRINGWPEEMDFDIRNISLYTYDVTPSGSGQNPNSGKKSTDENDEEDAV